MQDATGIFDTLKLVPADQKDSLENQHQSRVLMEDRKVQFNPTLPYNYHEKLLGWGQCVSGVGWKGNIEPSINKHDRGSAVGQPQHLHQKNTKEGKY